MEELLKAQLKIATEALSKINKYSNGVSRSGTRKISRDALDKITNLKISKAMLEDGALADMRHRTLLRSFDLDPRLSKVDVYRRNKMNAITIDILKGKIEDLATEKATAQAKSDAEVDPSHLMQQLAAVRKYYGDACDLINENCRKLASVESQLEESEKIVKAQETVIATSIKKIDELSATNETLRDSLRRSDRVNASLNTKLHNSTITDITTLHESLVKDYNLESLDLKTPRDVYKALLKEKNLRVQDLDDIEVSNNQIKVLEASIRNSHKNLIKINNIPHTDYPTVESVYRGFGIADKIHSADCANWADLNNIYNQTKEALNKQRNSRQYLVDGLYMGIAFAETLGSKLKQSPQEMYDYVKAELPTRLDTLNSYQDKSRKALD